jgi:DNA-nicking Smr family endonuclease
MATVNPIDPSRIPAAEPVVQPTATRPSKPVRSAVVPPPAAEPVPAKAAKATGPGVTLDGGWDRRLASGSIAPDSSIDLHGHTLDSAHRALDEGLARAIARGDRVLLLVTGKPPRPESERPHARGRIRSVIGDWIAASRHAPRIAAVRAAHPRHGGAGALYIILRRPREERKN